MTSGSVPLSSVVSVQGAFMRSVHLERDFESNLRHNYFPTASTHSVLATFENSLNNPANRALSLIGPFGAGKSAFCVRLAQSLRDKIRGISLPEDAESGHPFTGMLPVLVVGSREPIIPALVAGLYKSLSQPGCENILSSLPNREQFGSSTTAKQVADLYLTASKAAKCDEKGGILLIADEVGKFLEYAALDPKKGDVFVLQELAEAASRSNDNPFIFITVMHQSADTYAQKLGRGHRNEWMKVGERFKQVPFFPSDGERIDLVTKAIQHSATLRIGSAFDELAKQSVALGTVPSVIAGDFGNTSRAAYPLHPITLVALPALFRRIGQSHRSMFSFLSGDEGHSLGRYLSETTYDSQRTALYTLDMLFEYAIEIMPGGWSGSGTLRAWIEAADVVENAEADKVLAKRILRCIALLSLIKDPRLKATKAILCLSLDSNVSDVEEGLAELEHRGLIKYSRTREQYRLLETGDIDIEAALDAAKTTLPSGGILHVANNLCPPSPIVAKRHSYETGVLRVASQVPCTVGQLLKHLEATVESLRVFLVVAENLEEADQAHALLRQYTRADFMACVTTPTSVLQEAADDVVAAEHVNRETHELKGDRPARKELALRRSEAENAFTIEWDRLFGYGSNAASWWHKGEIQSIKNARQFYELLSSMADETFSLSPRLRNELINRSTLSSAGAAGRRKLIEALLTKAAEPRLGITGYPPELSMYECVLNATQVHREFAGGQWAISKPETADPGNIMPAWSKVEEMVFNDPPRLQPLIELFAALGQPPYGITDGIKPVLVSMVLAANPNEISLYRNGTFLPEPSKEDFEVLLRRPEQFAISGCRISGDRQIIVDRLAKGLKTANAVVPVVNALLKMVRALPEHAWKTSNLSESVSRLRECCEKARSPERLLFDDLPQALNLTLVDGRLTADGVERYFEALNLAIKEWSQVLPKVIEDCRNELLLACGYEVGSRGWRAFQADASTLESRVTDQRLRPLLSRASASPDPVASVESVLALIADRPTKSWTDLDRIRFSDAVKAVSILYKSAQGQTYHTYTLTPEQETTRIETEYRVRQAFGPEVDTAVRRTILKSMLRELDEAESNA